jgi:hypothetical protein
MASPLRVCFMKFMHRTQQNEAGFLKRTKELVPRYKAVTRSILNFLLS